MNPNWSCADICDKYGDSVSYCNTYPFRHFTKTRKFHGPVVTIKCRDDNSKVKEQLGIPKRGHVLIVDGEGSTNRALLGDVIANSALSNGWAGIVVYGVVRDSEALEDMEGIGIIALGTNARKSDRKGEGSVNEQVTFCGLTITPDYHIYVDQDGIILAENPLEI
jgi:regulator of ribonuclease activity A